MKRFTYLFAALVLTACGTGSETLKVMTMNVRYDNPADSSNNWQFRRDRVADLIASQQVDVLGTQEVLANQFDDLRGLLPDYEALGVGREDGVGQGEFCAVFFRKGRFTAFGSGTFWLSETPETAGSKGWDGACERIATWVLLRDVKGCEFLFVNTHLDHVGEIARNESVALLSERIEILRGDRPVILMGDFNAEPESSVIARVLANGLLRDAGQEAAERKGLTWSFSDFGRIPEAERLQIDYIFVGGDVAVEQYEILPDTWQGGYLSDHAPIVAEVRLGK